MLPENKGSAYSDPTDQAPYVPPSDYYQSIARPSIKYAILRFRDIISLKERDRAAWIYYTVADELLLDIRPKIFSYQVRIPGSTPNSTGMTMIWSAESVGGNLNDPPALSHHFNSELNLIDPTSPPASDPTHAPYTSSDGGATFCTIMKKDYSSHYKTLTPLWRPSTFASTYDPVTGSDALSVVGRIALYGDVWGKHRPDTGNPNLSDPNENRCDPDPKTPGWRNIGVFLKSDDRWRIGIVALNAAIISQYTNDDDGKRLIAAERKVGIILRKYNAAAYRLYYGSYPDWKPK